LNRGCNQFSNLLFSQPGGTKTGFVQIAVHPDEGLTGRVTGRWWEAVLGQASVQVPRQEERLTGGLPMWQSATREGHAC
jgi:hypothetical protein